ncbi:porin [Labrys portucalensis]|uniref:Porin n=1 Tax=Labrys neptuniae TaxID=376174 RepID=A0ABV6ZBR5_9HYPH
MTMKSLLLGAAAGIAAIGTAQAADLPMTKGEAVEYVKVCSAFGPGFFYIPGSDTCLKIGGEIRADYRGFGGDNIGFVKNTDTDNVFLSKGKFNRNNDRIKFNTQGRIWFDARTETEWGLLRSYFQINADSNHWSGTRNRFQIDKAFIQFGGLTAGYAHSFFGFYDNDYGNTIWAPYYAESNTVNLIAYTAQFGGGFSATLSIEDGRDHRQDGWGVSDFAVQGGQQVPDVVGQLRFDQSWGAVAVQAAGHQNRTAEALLPRSNKYGYAVGGTALIKIPAIDGGHFIVEGQYANAALDYLGAGNTVLGGADRIIDINGRYQNGKGWSVVAELGGNITPTLAANLVGSYIDTKYDRAFDARKTSIREYTIAGNLVYTIVKGLTIGAEVAYTNVRAKGFPTSADLGETVQVGNAKANIWSAGVRLKRTF